MATGTEHNLGPAERRRLSVGVVVILLAIVVALVLSGCSFGGNANAQRQVGSTVTVAVVLPSAKLTEPVVALKLAAPVCV